MDTRTIGGDLLEIAANVVLALLLSLLEACTRSSPRILITVMTIFISSLSLVDACWRSSGFNLIAARTTSLSSLSMSEVL